MLLFFTLFMDKLEARLRDQLAFNSNHLRSSSFVSSKHPNFHASFFKVLYSFAHSVLEQVFNCCYSNNCQTVLDVLRRQVFPIIALSLADGLAKDR